LALNAHLVKTISGYVAKVQNAALLLKYPDSFGETPA
jgi:hypothetical protein